VLKDVHTKVAAGQFVGIVGPTGAGKSTIVSMVPRFYDPSNGRVLIDGVDLRDFTLQGLRGQIGFVLQDTVLFRGTVRDNIAYGRPNATDADIVEAAKLANADEFIAKMPDGYHSMVGERGLTLSGGQRQRIGIARAIIRNAPILILDEPTAALDTESEKLVMEALQRLMKGRTVLTIAHRLSTIRDAHKILVLKDGVVAEEARTTSSSPATALRRAVRVQVGRAPAARVAKESRCPVVDDHAGRGRQPLSTRSRRSEPAREDVPLRRPSAARGGDRGAEPRREGAGDPESGPARRRAGERGDAREARESGHRGPRRQPSSR
jgi:ABC-type cobalamin/Fe3+-siderophores transport system ATPase subunit